MQRSTITVLEPATSFNLITLDELKAYLNVTSTSDDVRLQNLINFMSRVISDYCDRVFAREKVEETITNLPSGTLSYETEGGLLLSRWPVESIDSVTVGGGVIDYSLDADSGTLSGLVGGDVVITYTGGYDLPSKAPGPLALAAIDSIRQAFYFGSRDPFVQSLTDNATGSIRFFPPPGIGRSAGSSSGGGSSAKALSPQATALCLPYRRLAVA